MTEEGPVCTDCGAQLEVVLYTTVKRNEPRAHGLCPCCDTAIPWEERKPGDYGFDRVEHAD